MRSASHFVSHGNARLVFAAAVAIDRAFAGGVESFPGNAGRIVDPRFLRFGIAAGGLTLLDDIATGLTQPRIDFLQLVGVLDLDAEMIEPGFAPARRDREIHARIFQHPLGVIGFHDHRLRGKQRRVEADGMADILDGNVDMEALHGVSLSSRYFAALARGFAFGRGRAGNAAAAVISEKAEKIVHRLISRGIDH